MNSESWNRQRFQLFCFLGRERGDENFAGRALNILLRLNPFALLRLGFATAALRARWRATFMSFEREVIETSKEAPRSISAGARLC
jgi:hypothetical protein